LLYNHDSKHAIAGGTWNLIQEVGVTEVTLTGARLLTVEAGAPRREYAQPFSPRPLCKHWEKTVCLLWRICAEPIGHATGVSEI